MAKIYFDSNEVDKRTEIILEREAKVSSELPWRSAIH